MKNTDDDFKVWFSDLATQYYIAARLAAQAMLIPIYGNLLHHAIDMYLKAALVGTLPVADMKRKPYNHDLTALWQRFKAEESNPSLDSFDPTIQALHKFESIRYPDDIVNKGMFGSIAWEPHHAVTASGSAKLPPKYEVIIGNADNLVFEIFQRTQINPKVYLTGKVGGAVDEALTYQNPKKSFWKR